VVVPNRATFVTAWCYEVAIKLKKESDFIYILDLARYETRYRTNRFYWLLDQVIEKNDIRKKLRKGLIERGAILLDEKQIIGRSISSPIRPDDEQNFQEVIRSMYAAHYGTSEITLQDLNPNLVQRERESYNLVLTKLRVLFAEQGFDEVYSVNGRGLFDSCVITAAKELGLPYGMNEKTSQNWNYYSIQNVSTHSPLELQRKIDSCWSSFVQQKPPEAASRIAESYFGSPTTTDQVRWESLQSSLLYTPSLVEGKVVFFPASDHEFSVHIGAENLLRPYKTQAEAFDYLKQACNQLGLKLIVRVHPHLVGSQLQIAEDRLWKKLCDGQNIELISSSSPVNSLKLAEKSHTNVTYSSSIGAKLAFHNLPLIVMGVTEYAHLMPENLSTSRDSLLALLRNPRAPESSSVFPWVVYMTSGETRLETFEMKDFNLVFHRGKLLNGKRTLFMCLIRSLAKFKFYRTPLFSVR